MRTRLLIFIASAVVAIAWGIITRHDVAFGGEMVIPIVTGAVLWWEVTHESD